MTLIHISSYRYNQNSVALARAHINYLYEDIVIYFRYSALARAQAQSMEH